jgi:ligand-binding sensor domain-containing protein
MMRLKDGILSKFLDDPKVKNPSHLTLKMVEDIREDRNGTLWFASGMPPGEEGLCRFDGNALTQFKPAGESWLRTVFENREGVLWLGTRHTGTWIYDGKAFSPFSKDPHLGVPRLVDRSGNIWFSGEESENGVNSYTGIWRYDGKKLRNYTAKDGMPEFYIWCMVEDRTGNIWLGTRNMGLYRFDGKSFTSFSE